MSKPEATRNPALIRPVSACVGVGPGKPATEQRMPAGCPGRPSPERPSRTRDQETRRQAVPRIGAHNERRPRRLGKSWRRQTAAPRRGTPLFPADSPRAGRDKTLPNDRTHSKARSLRLPAQLPVSRRQSSRRTRREGPTGPPDSVNHHVLRDVGTKRRDSRLPDRMVLCPPNKSHVRQLVDGVIDGPTLGKDRFQHRPQFRP